MTRRPEPEIAFNGRPHTANPTYYACSGSYTVALRATNVRDAIAEVRLSKHDIARVLEIAAADPDSLEDPQTFDIYRTSDHEPVAKIVDVTPITPRNLPHMTAYETSAKLKAFARKLGYHCVSIYLYDYGLPKTPDTRSEHFSATIIEGSFTAQLNALIIDHDPSELILASAAHDNCNIIDVSQPTAARTIEHFCEELRLAAANCPSA